METTSTSSISSQNPHPQSIQQQQSLQQQKWAEYKANKKLVARNYQELAKNFKKTYILRNKSNGLIAEIRAISDVHACTLLGWNPKKTQLLGIKDVEPDVEPETEKQPTPKPDVTSATEPAKD